MGMSASQARLLSITSRMNDIELRSQQISNTKIRLADESEQVANNYTRALNASKLTYTDYSSGQAKTVDLTPKNLSNYGLCLVNRSDNSIFSGDVTPAQMYEMIESGQFFLAKAGKTTQAQAQVPTLAQIPTPTQAQAPTLAQIPTPTQAQAQVPTLANSNNVTFVNKLNPTNTVTNWNTISGMGQTGEVINASSKKYTFTDFWDEVDFEDTAIKTYLQNPEEVSVSGNTFLNIQSDDTNLAKAEAEYNAQTAKINAKEKKLDQQMKEMDTEHSALKTEYDSVKSLISDNISKSFQLFS